MNPPVALVRTGAVVRRLEGTERLVAMGTARFRCNFQVTAMVELEGPVTREALHQAAQRVQQQHACLQVEVAEDPTHPLHYVFRETDARIRVEEVDAAHPDAWRGVWDRMLQTPIEGLTWRLTWVRTPGARVSQLVAGFHHAISDIGSLSVFFDSLLKALDDVHHGRPSSQPFVPLHGALSRVVRSRWPVRALAKVAWYRYFGRLRTLPLDHEAPIPLEERGWSGPFRTIEADPLAALVERCRANGVTLGHAVSAATILEIADRVRLREQLSKFDVSLSTSLDLRRSQQFPGLNPRQMGLMVTVVQTFYRPRADDTVWSLAQRVKKELEAVKARNEHRDFALAPNLLGPRTAAWVASQNAGRPPEGALLISNFGRLDDLAHGPFMVRRIFFTAAQSVFGTTLLFASGTLRGRMFIHLGHPVPALSEATGAAVMDGVLERVGVSAARAEPCSSPARQAQ